MKIIFVMPAMGRRDDAPYVDSWKMEPLTIATLAGLTPKEAEIKFYDDRIEAVPFDEPADIAAINVEAYTATRAYYIAAQFKKRGVTVVLGGYHATLMPEEAALHADAVVSGEAEILWPQLLTDFKNKSLKRVYSCDKRPALSGIRPDRSVYAGKKYLPLSLVETTRGCLHNCNFCSIGAFYRSTHNYRPVEEVAAEIAGLKHRTVFFVDDNIAANPRYTEELCRAITPLKIRWITQCSLKAAENPRLLRLMSESGCAGVLIGFESLNPENLRQMNKTWNEADASYAESIQKFRDNGITIYATFLFGYDHDDQAAIRKTVEFAINQKFLIAAFNHLLPFPGTPLHDIFAKEKRLLNEKWWLCPDYAYGDIVFRPKNFSPEGLAEACVNARRDFYSASSILARAADLKANCRTPWMALAYFWCNILLRREVRQKRALKLGARCN